MALHGAGMNRRGIAQVEMFGPLTLPEYDAAITRFAEQATVNIEIFRSNTEGDLIDKLYEAHTASIDGAIIKHMGVRLLHVGI